MARILIPDIPVNLLSTNVADSSLAEYSTASVAYTVGNEVALTNGQPIPHHAFRAKQDHTSSEATAPVVGGNAHWLDLGAINQHAMFDGLNNTPTIADDPSGDIIVTLALTRRLQTVSLLGLRTVRAVTIAQAVDSVERASTTLDLSTSRSGPGWWSWLFGERTYSKSAVFRLAGNYAAQTLEITLHGAPSAQCSQLMISEEIDLGCTIEAQPRIKKWSTFRANAFGDYQFTPRKGTRTGSYTLLMDTADVDRVYALMEDIEERLVILDANNDDTAFDSIRAYGSIIDFAPGITYNKTRCDIKIEGIN